MTATFSQGGPYDGLLYVYPAGLSTDFLTDLGFTMTTGFEEYAPEEGSQAEISAENVGLIDADVIVFATEDQKMFDGLQEFGTVGSLDAVTGEPRRLHRRHPRRRHLLRHPAQPARTPSSGSRRCSSRPPRARRPGPSRPDLSPTARSRDNQGER